MPGHDGDLDLLPHCHDNSPAPRFVGPRVGHFGAECVMFCRTQAEKSHPKVAFSEVASWFVRHATTYLVPAAGIELATYALRVRCSTN